MHENIGKQVKITALKKGKNDMLYTIIAVCGNLYVCRSEGGNLTRFKEEDVEVIEQKGNKRWIN